MEDFRDYYYGLAIDGELKAAQDRLKRAAESHGIDSETVELLFDYADELRLGFAIRSEDLFRILAVHVRPHVSAVALHRRRSVVGAVAILVLHPVKDAV